MTLLTRSRTRGSVAAGALAAIMTMSACSSPEAGTPTPSAGNPDATVKVVASLEPATLNPIYMTNNWFRTIGQLYDGLIAIDENGFPTEAGLLTSWNRVDDNTWSFILRDGVHFHDGSDFTAEDIVFTIGQMQSDPQARYGSFAKRIASVEASDPHTVAITTVAPDESIPALFTVIRPIPSDYYEQVGAAGFDAAPIGTGPFEFVAKKPGQSVTLTRNDDYWGESAKIKQLDISWSTDPSARVSLVQSGSVDIAYDIPPQSWDLLDGAEGVGVLRGPSGTSLQLVTRVGADPSAQATAREAISLAIDREGLVAGVMGGTADPQFRFLTITLPDAPEPSIEFDSAQAKKLLAGSSPKVHLYYTSGTFQQDKAIGEAVAAMLTTAGFTVQQDVQELAKIYDATRSPANPEEVAVYLLDANQVYPDPDVTIGYYLVGLGICGDADQYKALSAEGLAAAPDDRGRVYAEAEEKAINEDHCWLPFAQLFAAFAVSDEISGFGVPYIGSPDFAAITAQ
ncbi:MAG: ABC transporter substrate-binding protein [Microbacterium sp.]